MKNIKMIIILSILIVLYLDTVYAVLYSINRTEFYRMPPKIYLEDYDKCLQDPDGLYCTVHLSLVSDTPSELVTMIKDYSDHSVRHFNHTNPHYGLCVSKTCQQFIKSNVTGLEEVLEGCLNETMWDKYKLKTKIHNSSYLCTQSNEINKINTSDVIVLALLVIIVIINLVATSYDNYIGCTKKEANKYLINFSISRNLTKLLEVSNRSDPRQDRLKCLDCTKSTLIMMVIMGHSIQPLVALCQNVYDLEGTYDNILWHIYYNGSIIVQVFFTISGFLLAYNLEIASEREPLHYLEIPKRIALRWLRLTPPYALVLGISATWLRFAQSGPLWKTYVNNSVNECRSNWWANLLYINNYYDNYFRNGTKCMLQTWYLAADFQLHIIGLLVCVLCKGPVRKAVLGLLFIAGIIAPGLHTYFQDLNGTLLLYLEFIRSMFVKDRTFNIVYIATHTNAASFIMGLSLGLIIYRVQNTNFDIKKYSKIYVYLFKLSLPVSFAVILVGMVGFRNGPKISIFTRVVLSVLVKPFFSAIFAFLIFGIVFKFDKFYRRFGEAYLWTVLCRVSYCAYICHMGIVQIFAGSSQMMIYNVYTLFIVLLGSLICSFILAVILWLFVESPFLGVIDTIRSKSREDKIATDNDEQIAREKKDYKLRRIPNTDRTLLG